VVATEEMVEEQVGIITLLVLIMVQEIPHLLHLPRDLQVDVQFLVHLMDLKPVPVEEEQVQLEEMPSVLLEDFLQLGMVE
jgi:hypothetical protein